MWENNINILYEIVPADDGISQQHIESVKAVSAGDGYVGGAVNGHYTRTDQFHDYVIYS